MTGPIEAVRRYHDQSTHHPGRYARGPGFLDWDNQPDPFRAYPGAPVLELPVAGDRVAASWGDLHRPGAVPPSPLDRATLGAFLELSLGITAWKEHASARWALRANPSSGNLHPTEAYLVVPEAPGVPAGLHHYRSRDHVLERRSTPAPSGAEALSRLLAGGALLVGLASIHWREAWKYGERAFRYCQHDAGHALGAIGYAAAALGWSARLLETPGDGDVAAVLGLDRGEGSLSPPDREHPDALLVAAPRERIDEAARRVEGGLAGLCAAVRDGSWAGRPNALSPTHVDWPAIEDVSAACAKPRTHAPGGAPGGASGRELLAPLPGGERRAVSLVRGRRSAVAMDGVTGLPAPAFHALADALLPRVGLPPWCVLPWSPRVHLVLFLHRVEGLAPGVYLLERAVATGEALRAALRPSFAWERPDGCPEGLPLFRLEEGDARPLARFASCHQDIAADSAFAVAMLADLGPALDKGAWWYRRLHWEAGLVGQALYLWAEAAGRRATGIGCYFDDVVHDALGLSERRFRDLYHFTVGGAVEDHRLTTRPGYEEAVTGRA